MPLAVLDTTTKSLAIKLAGAVSTDQPEFAATYRDISGAHGSTEAATGETNSTTAVTVVAAPPAGVQRVVHGLWVENIDSAAVTVVLLLKDSAGVDREIYRSATVAANASLGVRDAVRNPLGVVLGSSTQSLAIELAGVAATDQPEFCFNYEDSSGGHTSYGSSTGETNSTTEVTAVAAPPAGVRRTVVSAWISNLDSASVTLKLTHKDSAGIDRDVWRSGSVASGASVSPSVVHDHGALAGLGDDDHSQYLRSDAADQATGVITFNAQPTSQPTGAGANNEAWGAGAGALLGAGAGNSFLGAASGASVTTGTNNTCGGYLSDASAAASDQTVFGKSAIGRGAGQTLLGARAAIGTAANGVAIGMDAGNSTGTGSANFAMGASALQSFTSGTRCFGFGNTALQNLTTGASVMGLGVAAGISVVGGSRCVFIGDTADGAAAGNDCTVVGHQADADGSDNSVFGSQASVAASKTDACVFGKGAGSEGSGGIAIGDGTHTGTANNCVLIGNAAGKSTASGAANCGVGAFVLDALTTGNRNMAFGNSSLGACTTGASNVGVGVSSGDAIVGGSRNVLIGDAAACGASQADTVGIGHNASITADKGIGIGRGVSIGHNAIGLGYNAATTAASQGLFGTSTTPVGLMLYEMAAAAADIAAYGQIWVKSDTPNTLWFTDDAGTDVQIGTSSRFHDAAAFAAMR